MIHFSCDLCGKDLEKRGQDRFVVHIAIRPADDAWQLDEDDLEDDNLEKVSQILQSSSDDDEVYGAAAPVQLRFDFCPSCRDRFLKNPFHCKFVSAFNFSKN